MPDLLSIGQFAKLCHTTTDTLIHYNDIGLFTPAELTAQNRRYYHVSQCYTFKTIQFLAETGTTLTDIRQMLSNTPLPNLTVVLQNQLEQLELRKYYLESTMYHIKEHQNICSKYDPISFGQPFILTHEKPQNMFATFTQSISPKDIFQSLENHITTCTENHIYPFPIGFYIKKQSLRAQDSQTLLIYSPFPNGQENNRTLIRPAGEYAALIHKGSCNKLKNSIQRLREFISATSSYVPGDSFITCYDNCSSQYEEALYLVQTHKISVTPHSSQ